MELKRKLWRRLIVGLKWCFLTMQSSRVDGEGLESFGNSKEFFGVLGEG